MTRALASFGAFLMATSLVACGGGSGSPGSTLPSSGASPTSSPSSGTQNANFVIAIPAGSTSSSTSRRPLDFSASTQSVTIAIGSQTLATANVGASSSACVAATGGGRTCTVGVNAPVGNDTFTITAYDQPGGAGSVLSTGTVVETISAGSAATVNVAVSGAIAKLALSLGNAYPPAGTATTSSVVVTGLDADGNAVLGTFATPVSLADSDTTGYTSLSASSATSSSSSVTLNYTGGTPIMSATITASLAGVPSVSATFAPSPAFLTTYQAPVAKIHGFSEEPGLADIKLGPDGNMWAVGSSYAEILKISPSGTYTTYPLSQSSYYPEGLVVGSDGNLWFCENQHSSIAKITTSGAITEYRLPGTVALPYAVALGPDGNVWFVDQYQHAFGNITPAGTITEYPMPSQGVGYGITTGPDGNMWITDQKNNAIVKASTAGTVLGSYPIPSSDAQPYGIAAGPDGNMWFTEFYTGKIGRVTPSGTMTEFTIPTGSAGPMHIYAGPDGRIWYTEMGAEVGNGKIGYITTSGQMRDFMGDGLHINSLAFDANNTIWYTAAQLPRGNQEVGTFAY
jgi:streptogramin lyase